MQKRINIFHNNLDKLHGIDDKLRLQYWKTEILSCEIIEPIVKATVASYNSITESRGDFFPFSLCWNIQDYLKIARSAPATPDMCSYQQLLT